VVWVDLVVVVGALLVRVDLVVVVAVEVVVRVAWGVSFSIGQKAINHEIRMD
jgi:hypothetical protein